jgi:hypothetical protein
MGVESFEGVPFPVNTPDDVAWAVLFCLLRCEAGSYATQKDKMPLFTVTMRAGIRAAEKVLTIPICGIRAAGKS